MRILIKEFDDWDDDNEVDVSIFEDELISKKFNNVAEIRRYVNRLIEDYEEEYGETVYNNFYDYFEIEKMSSGSYKIKIIQPDILNPDEWDKIDIIEPRLGLLRQVAESTYSDDYKIYGPSLVNIDDYIETADYLDHDKRIDNLADEIIDNRKFEPIIVDSKEKYVIEGQHRIRALKRKGFKKILAYTMYEI